MIKKLAMRLLTMAVVFSTSRAVPADDLKTKFQGLYDALVQAVADKKVDDVLGILADDFISVNAKGQAKSHEASVEDMKSMVTLFKSGHMKFTVQEVKQNGGSLMVRNRLESDIVLSDGKEEHHLVSDEISDDTWVVVGDGVRLQKSVTVSRTGKVDDKPIE